MKYYDPLLGFWGLVPGGRALARADQRVWTIDSNTGLATAYTDAGVTVADVAATFRIDDFTDTIVVPGRGRLSRERRTRLHVDVVLLAKVRRRPAHEPRRATGRSRRRFEQILQPFCRRRLRGRDHMPDLRVIPFLVSELRLTPDEQELLQREWWPSYAHAVVHPDGIFLFDNGAGFGNAEVESTFTPKVTAIEDALATHGISLADVTGAANCHLHFDHSGQNVRIPAGVPIFVQRAEWAKVYEPDYTVPEWIDAPGLTYEVMDGEIEVAPGLRLDPHARAHGWPPVTRAGRRGRNGRARGAGGAVAGRMGGCDGTVVVRRLGRHRPRLPGFRRAAALVRTGAGALRARPRRLAALTRHSRADRDRIAHADGSALRDPGVHAPQTQPAALGAVHEPQRVRSESSRELGAAGVGLLRHLDLGVADDEPRAGRQVFDADVEVRVDLIAGERPSRDVTGDRIRRPGVHQR